MKLSLPGKPVTNTASAATFSVSGKGKLQAATPMAREPTSKRIMAGALALMIAIPMLASCSAPSDIADSAASSSTESNLSSRADAQGGERQGLTSGQEDAAREVKHELLLEDGTMLGGWWIAETDATKRYVYFISGGGDPDYRVYDFDGAGRYGCSLSGSGSLEVTSPVRLSEYGELVDESDTVTVALSDGTALAWQMAQPNSVERISPGSADLFPERLARAQDIPDALKMYVTRSEYGWRYSELDGVADMQTSDGFQIVSGTVRITSDGELMAEKFGYEWSGEPVRAPMIVLELDTPTLMEARDGGSLSALFIRPVESIAIFDQSVDWEALESSHVILGVDARSTTFPSDVQPYDASTNSVTFM